MAAAPLSALSLATDGLAFSVGALTTYFDCYQTMTIRVGRVPETFRTEGAVIGLAELCGLVALTACVASSLYPESVLATVLTLKAPDPWRGAVVGASVLVLIRSKLFNIENSPFGGDYLYDLGRNGAIEAANRKYTLIRLQFQNSHQPSALRQGPQFEADLLALVDSTLAARAQPVQSLFMSKLKAITNNRPSTTFDPANIAWITYYRALIGVGLGACGPTAVRTLNGLS